MARLSLAQKPLSSQAAHCQSRPQSIKRFPEVWRKLVSHLVVLGRKSEKKVVYPPPQSLQFIKQSFFLHFSMVVKQGLSITGMPKSSTPSISVAYAHGSRQPPIDLLGGTRCGRGPHTMSKVALPQRKTKGVDASKDM